MQLSEISSNCTDCVTDGQPYELGCQGLAPWIIRSGKLFQGWFRFTQCPGFVYLDGAAMIRAQLCGFRHSVNVTIDESTGPGTEKGASDCIGPQFSHKQLVDCRCKVLSSKWTSEVLRPSSQSLHFVTICQEFRQDDCSP